MTERPADAAVVVPDARAWSGILAPYREPNDARGALEPRDKVVLRFLAGVRQVELAGKVVWHEPSSEDEVNTGIELDPELTSDSMFRAYKAWLRGQLGA